jgi:hypothetical protein
MKMTHPKTSIEKGIISSTADVPHDIQQFNRIRNNEIDSWPAVEQ